VSLDSLMKNRLLSLWISFLVVTGHIHFRPIGSSLFVFARFIVFHSLSAFFLRMVLDLAVKAVFPVPVAIVTTSGVSSAGSRRSGSLIAVPALESVIPFVLEGRHFILGVFLVVLVFSLTVVLDGRNWFGGFQSGFPLSIGGHLMHVVQRHRGWIVLGHGFPQVPWKRSPEELHFEKLQHVVGRVGGPLLRRVFQ
jgi:hypothetical protein